MKRIFKLFTGICLVAFVGCDSGKSSHGSDQDSSVVDSSHAHVRETYGIEYSTAPSEIVAGQPTMLTIEPVIEGKPGVSVPLDVYHEKKIHLIMVSEDLQWFAHAHPEYQQDGKYTLSQAFPAGGQYLLYVDFKPSGGDPLQERIMLNVSGKPAVSKSYTQAQLVSKAGGYEVKLSTTNGKFASGSMQHIAASITKGGKPVNPTTLDDYLGAKAHVVVIGLQDKDYLHVHPNVEDGMLDLHATFSKPGIYRCWLQFQASGKVETADFVLDVVQGTGEDAATGHGHEGHDHGGDSHEGHDHSH